MDELQQFADIQVQINANLIEQIRILTDKVLYLESLIIK